MTEAACWSHSRRKFFQLAELVRAPLTVAAVRRTDAIFDVERSINGLPVAQRLAIRKQHVELLVGALESWMRAAMGQTRARMSPIVAHLWVKYADTSDCSMPKRIHETGGHSLLRDERGTVASRQ